MNRVVSLNCDFLAAHDGSLRLYVAMAERYVFDDPNTSLIKLRQFAELLARHAAAFCGIETGGMEFRDIVGVVRNKRIAPRDIVELLDYMRMSGNEAAHEGSGDSQLALTGLIAAHKLANWFQKTFVDRDFLASTFKPPRHPEKIAESLRKELEDLREEFVQNQVDLAESQGKVLEVISVRDDLERQVEGYQKKLLEVEQQFTQTEEGLRQEREDMEARLRQVIMQAEKSPAMVTGSFVQRGKRAALAIGLRGQDAEYVPIAQLRIKVSEQTWCCKVPELLVQSSAGGMVTANCSRCNKARSVRFAEFEGLDVWVSCPKCRVKTDPVKVSGNYSYICRKCGWACNLATLLPRWDEAV